MVSHTPGPYSIKKIDDELWIYGNGILLARMELSLRAAEGNARLFAAAPRMLDELEGIYRLLVAFHAVHGEHIAFDEHRRIIGEVIKEAKEGQQNEEHRKDDQSPA